MSKQVYENCRVEKVIRGDQVLVTVHLGFDVKITVPIRLVGIDAANLFTEEGQVALSQLSALCLGAEVSLETFGKLGYEWLGVIHRKTDHLDINDEMVRLGVCDKQMIK